MGSYVTAREVEGGGVRGEGGQTIGLQYSYSIFLVWEKRQTLNKATIHAIVNYD